MLELLALEGPFEGLNMKQTWETGQLFGALECRCSSGSFCALPSNRLTDDPFNTTPFAGGEGTSQIRTVE